MTDAKRRKGDPSGNIKSIVWAISVALLVVAVAGFFVWLEAIHH